MSQKFVTLDVREDLRRGREPFSKIMRTATGLKPNEDLLLIAPFEPAPLYSVLAQQGFSHTSKALDGGDWEVRFCRTPQPSTPGASSMEPTRSAEAGESRADRKPAAVVELDARGLEPPQPLVKILEALAGLPPGASLRARTDRRPMHLYPQIEERGFVADTEQDKDGSFITNIRRA